MKDIVSYQRMNSRMFLGDPNMPRGIRNNNPGNIEISPHNPWRGSIDGPDDRFETFAAPEWGIRAIVKILRSYQRRGVRTVADIIATWAPAFENNVGAYIGSVSAESGLQPDSVLDFSNPIMIEEFVKAIIYHENGMQPYDKVLIAAGVEMGLTT